MVKAKDLKLLRKKIEKADRMDKSTIQKCIDSSSTIVSQNDATDDDDNNNNNNTNDNKNHHDIEFFTSADVGNSVVKELLDLFEENMGNLYRQSSWGLNLNEKKQEFQHRKARFLIVRQQQQGHDDAPSNDADDTTSTTTPPSTSSLVAYCHYRYCLDDDEQPTCAVLYVYELQVAANQQRNGWGRTLMKIMQQLAHAAEMSKITLTVFIKNTQAMQFYRNSLQYDIDPTSPSQYNEHADYEILSKTIL